MAMASLLTKYRRFIGLGGMLLGALLPLPLWSQVPPNSVGDASTLPRLKVGVRVLPPFVIERSIEKASDSGDQDTEVKPLINFAGIDIDLWHIIAASQQWEYDYYLYETVESGLQGLNNGELDILLGGVEITAERLAKADFSQPYYFSYPALLIKPKGFGHFFHPFLRFAIIGALASILISISLFAHAIWWVERKQNPDHFPHCYWEGLAAAYWFTAVTMTTVGYGDTVPVTGIGRRLTFIWMWVGMAISSSVTAALASGLTLSVTQNPALSSEKFLQHQPHPTDKVAVIGEAFDTKILRSIPYLLVQTQDFQQALTLLNQDQIKAILYFIDPLRYYQQSQSDETYEILTLKTSTLAYGFSMRPAEPRLRQVNIALVEMLANQQVDQIIDRYVSQKSPELADSSAEN